MVKAHRARNRAIIKGGDCATILETRGTRRREGDTRIWKISRRIVLPNDQKISRRRRRRRAGPSSLVARFATYRLKSTLRSLCSHCYRRTPRSWPSLGRWLLMQRARSARPTLKNGRPAMIQSFARAGRYRVGGRTLRRKYSAKQVAEFTSKPRSEHLSIVPDLSIETFPSVYCQKNMNMLDSMDYLRRNEPILF